MANKPKKQAPPVPEMIAAEDISKARKYGVDPTVEMVNGTCVISAFEADKEAWEAKGFKIYNGPQDKRSSSVYPEKSFVEPQKADD